MKILHLDTTALISGAVERAMAAKTWSGHQRADTIGASEIGGCARAVWYDKNAYAPDAEYVQDWGALERGHAAERWVVERLQEALKDTGVTLLWASDEGQNTLVSGPQSATPDGLFVASPNDQVELVDPETGELVQVSAVYNEIKSIDPRPFETLDKPKRRHVFQCQQGMDLVRRLTPYQPEYAVITYVNASFYSQQKRYVVKYDERFATGLRGRAAEILFAAAPPRAEGKFLPNECDYCPHRRRCAALDAETIPETVRDLDGLDPAAVARLGELAARRKELQAQAQAYDAQRKELELEIGDLLRALDTKKIKAPWGSVSLYQAYPPAGLDEDALRTAGVDPDQFRKSVQPYAKLTVSVKG